MDEHYDGRTKRLNELVYLCETPTEMLIALVIF